MWTSINRYSAEAEERHDPASAAGPPERSRRRESEGASRAQPVHYVFTQHCTQVVDGDGGRIHAAKHDGPGC